MFLDITIKDDSAKACLELIARISARCCKNLDIFIAVRSK